jgi:hypothetical protein
MSRLFVRPFRRKGIDDLLEARIAAERVPRCAQFQTTVCWTAGQLRGNAQLLYSEVFLSGPRGDDGEVIDHERSIDRVLGDGQKLHAAAAFTQGILFSAESRVDPAEDRHIMFNRT